MQSLSPLRAVRGTRLRFDENHKRKSCDQKEQLEFVRMQLREALTTINEFSSADLPLCSVLLVTGFNPLHLKPFFHAHLQRLLPTRKVVVSTGIYDDLAGTVARIESSPVDMSAVAIEWPDLDRRLGFRHLGGWGPKELSDIVAGVESKILEIRENLEAAEKRALVAVSMPTLDLPPVFHTPSWQLCEAEARILHAVSAFALWASTKRNIRLANTHSATINADFQPAFDFKSEILAGLPYTTPHASRLGQILAQLLIPAQPKKGLITDLDDTLWAGIAGEVGPAAVSWDLDNKSQPHGLYQQLLRALAEQGVLIGAASKNEPAIVEEVFRRTDVLLPRDYVFPMEARWTPKPESVARILDAWGVHPDSVVFVDDSASEIAEVKAAYPDMECIGFDAQNYTEIHSLLYRLRDLFAKQTITEEDGLRRESLRASGISLGGQQASASHESFLRDAEAQITLDFNAAATNPRSLELVNKTNQFNLNGIRYTESEWQKKLALPGSFFVTASYRDKYGLLGVIAVLMGQISKDQANDAVLTVNTWVMSCRAFGRRIEYQCLTGILDRFPQREVVLEFSPTSRNHYLAEFFESILGQRPEGQFAISRAAFLDKCPKLYHQVEIVHE